MLFPCFRTAAYPDASLCSFPVSGLLPCVPGHRQDALLGGSPGRPHGSTWLPHHGGLQQPHQSQFCSVYQSQSSSVLSIRVSLVVFSVSKLVKFCALYQSQSSSVSLVLYSQSQSTSVLSVKVILVLFSLSKSV